MTKRLSKTRFQTGLQCELALWRKCHAPELADPITEQQQHIFDTGTAVGELARGLFPDGVLVAEDHTASREALEKTSDLLGDPPRALFEGAFEHGGVFVRPDLLVRVGPGEWDLYEVKSGTRVKAEHITDVAIQRWVLEGAGLSIRRAYLTHLNRDYVFEGGEHILEDLFVSEDVTRETAEWLPQIPGIVHELLAMLAAAEPDVMIGKHCDSPYTCDFWGACHDALPPAPVTELPRVSADTLSALLAEGIYAISDVPADYPGLSSFQREVCETVRSGEASIVGDLGASLSGLRFPIHFVDFETMMSALPLHPGTRPWQQIPFQWSDHVLHEDGSLEHLEFLHEGDGDPRPGFVESLLAATERAGSIVTYTHFESVRMDELAAALPQYAAALAHARARIFDLEKVVRLHVRHPDCVGRTTLKRVLPALVDDLGYHDLAIAEGSVASQRYLAAATGGLEPEERSEVFADLRAYCATDTLAMVRLYEVLRDSVSQPLGRGA